jgi:hypothetical protein
MRELSYEEILNTVDGTVEIKEDSVSVKDEKKIREVIDDLIYTAVFGGDREKEFSRWLIRAIALDLGIVPSSIHDLYTCLLYTSPSPRDGLLSRMPSSA